MMSKEEVIVLSHYLKQGLSKTAIANKLGVSRRTVQRYAEKEGAEPKYGPRPPRASILDPYKAYIGGRLQTYPDLSSVRLLKEIEALGFKGRYTVVKDYIHGQRPKQPLPIEQRFEVEPGHQAQVDFATFKTPFGVVYALLVVLSWSRSLWVRFRLHQDELTVLNGLHKSFQSFGGVPRTVLFDRMKTAVAGADGDGAAIFNAEMLRFAAHYGFRPVACRPYRAKTKGRVERAVSYLRHNFFYGRRFRDLEDLNNQAEAWLQETANARVHGTTGEIPKVRLEQERSRLLPVPQELYVPMITLGRRMTRDGFVSYNGNEYSVPEGVGRADIQVQATLTEVRLLQDGELLVSHPLLEGRGERHLAPGHVRRGAGWDHYSRDSSPGLIRDTVEVQCRPLDVYEAVLQ